MLRESCQFFWTIHKHFDTDRNNSYKNSSGIKKLLHCLYLNKVKMNANLSLCSKVWIAYGKIQTGIVTTAWDSRVGG